MQEFIEKGKTYIRQTLLPRRNTHENVFSYLDGDPQRIVYNAQKAITYLLHDNPDYYLQSRIHEIADRFANPLKAFLRFEDEMYDGLTPYYTATRQPLSPEEYAKQGYSTLMSFREALRSGRLHVPAGFQKSTDSRQQAQGRPPEESVIYLDIDPIDPPPLYNDQGELIYDGTPDPRLIYKNPINSLARLLLALASPITESEAEDVLEKVVIPTFIGLARHNGVELIENERTRRKFDIASRREQTRIGNALHREQQMRLRR